MTDWHWYVVRRALKSNCGALACWDEHKEEGLLVTWLHLRTHHLWRTIKEVGLLSEDHLPQGVTALMGSLRLRVKTYKTNNLERFT